MGGGDSPVRGNTAVDEQTRQRLCERCPGPYRLVYDPSTYLDTGNPKEDWLRAVRVDRLAGLAAVFSLPSRILRL